MRKRWFVGAVLAGAMGCLIWRVVHRWDRPVQVADSADGWTLWSFNVEPTPTWPEGFILAHNPAHLRPATAEDVRRTHSDRLHFWAVEGDTTHLYTVTEPGIEFDSTADIRFPLGVCFANYPRY